MVDYKYEYGRYGIGGIYYIISINNMTMWVYNLYTTLIKYVNTEYAYKDIRFIAKIKPYEYFCIEIYWSGILVLELNLNTIDIMEFHYDEVWIMQFLELYEEQYAKNNRKHIQELVDKQLKYEEEQRKKFLLLKDM